MKSFNDKLREHRLNNPYCPEHLRASEIKREDRHNDSLLSWGSYPTDKKMANRIRIKEICEVVINPEPKELLEVWEKHDYVRYSEFEGNERLIITFKYQGASHKIFILDNKDVVKWTTIKPKLKGM